MWKLLIFCLHLANEIPYKRSSESNILSFSLVCLMKKGNKKNQKKTNWNSFKYRLTKTHWWKCTKNAPMLRNVNKWRMMELMCARKDFSSIPASLISLNDFDTWKMRSTSERLERQNGKPIKRWVPLNTFKRLSSVGRPFNKIQNVVCASFQKPNRMNANQPASTKTSYLSWIAKANYTCVTYKLVICEWFFHSTWCFRISLQNLIKYTKASVQVCIQRIATTSSFNWNELQTSKTWKIASKWKRIRKKNIKLNMKCNRYSVCIFFPLRLQEE